jgi:hypothetical protein
MFECPHCGEPLPDNARACPYCGSDDETGWNPDREYLSVELPERDDEAAAPPRPGGVSNAFAYFLILVGLLGLLAFSGPRALLRPFTLLGVVIVVTVILVWMRRSGAPRREP